MSLCGGTKSKVNVTLGNGLSIDMISRPVAALYGLPDDAARALAAFLDRDGLEHVAATNRFASRHSFFQSIRDARALSLTLPVGCENDQCRRLLHAIHRRNPQRLTSMQWIELSVLWQAQSLLEVPEISANIHHVRVRTPDGRDAVVVAQICETLSGLTELLKLDMMSTPLEDIAVIARMTQLRELDFSGTKVTDVSPLAALAELRVLVVEETHTTCLRCIQSMRHLEVLKVSQSASRNAPGKASLSVYIPSFESNSQLHTLELHGCTVESTADFFHVASSLRFLSLLDVQPRHSIIEDKTAWPLRDIHEDELAERLVKLESISLALQNVLVPTASLLAKIPSLRAIHHAIDGDLRGVEPLVNLEEIHLVLREGDDSDFLTREPEDYGVLLRLPQLKKVTVYQTTRLPWHWGPDVEPHHDALVQAHATELTSVLMQMPQLTSFDYNAYIPNDSFLPGMRHLEHLRLHNCDPEIPPLEWLRSFGTLRSLDLTLPSFSDLSAIGDCVSLEKLCLRSTTLRRGCGHRIGQHHFLARLVNLRSLEMGSLEDVEYLRGMTMLETLTVGDFPPDATAWRSLISLRSISTQTTRDISSLALLPQLREATIPATADCRPLVAHSGPPRLLRVLHGGRNCIARCHHRDVLNRREMESRQAVYDSDQEKGSAVFATMTTEDY